MLSRKAILPILLLFCIGIAAAGTITTFTDGSSYKLYFFNDTYKSDLFYIINFQN